MNKVDGRIEAMSSISLRQRLGNTKELALLKLRGADFPPVAPALGKRGVFIGTANSAGQGWAWARALERTCPSLQAVSARFGGEDSATGFSFQVDQPIYSHYAAHSHRWQKRQFAALRDYRAVIIESGDAVLARLYRGDTASQARALESAGVRLALLFHGSDIRDPESHQRTEAHSHFSADQEFAHTFRTVTRENRTLIEELALPVFVSTPDLLDEVPGSTWLPVVVDTKLWANENAPRIDAAPVRVAHVPSSSSVKGTELIEPLLLELADAGKIEYTPIRGIPHGEMPNAYRSADIVIDQFRVGNYGVAACEAMAAGRIVVSHVSDRVRALTLGLTGDELPIVEATPETLRRVLEDIRINPAPYQEVALRGVDFVRKHHDGNKSGNILADWLGLESGV